MARNGWPALFWGTVVASAIITVGLIACWPSKASVIQAVLLVATFWAVAFYTFETRRLRLQQRADQEIHLHPWISISDFSFTENPGPKASAEDILFKGIITNLGLTPALDVSVEAWFVWKSDRDNETYLKTTAGVLVPHQKMLWQLPIKVVGKGTGELHLILNFHTLAGGSGVYTVEGEMVGPTTFRQLASEYAVTLSSGQIMPGGAAPGVISETNE